jgi:2-dehydropantoate 2-reductase
MTGLRITVLGSGSVGLALAATYARADVDVTVLARGLAVQQLQQSGITVTGVAGDHQIEPRRLKVSDVESPDP